MFLKDAQRNILRDPGNSWKCLINCRIIHISTLVAAGDLITTSHQGSKDLSVLALWAEYCRRHADYANNPSKFEIYMPNGRYYDDYVDAVDSLKNSFPRVTKITYGNKPAAKVGGDSLVLLAGQTATAQLLAILDGKTPKIIVCDKRYVFSTVRLASYYFPPPPSHIFHLYVLPTIRVLLLNMSAVK